MVDNFQFPPQPDSVTWADEFAHTYIELSNGECDIHNLLDWAYELYPTLGHGPAVDAAMAEFQKANPEG